MKLSTSQQFAASPEVLWPLLFNSKMDNRQPCYFLCGLPKPVECRLPQGQGGVGQIRECVSDKGVIVQEILAWEPANRLQFRLRETDIYFGPCVESIVENFQIRAVEEGQAVITRTTEFRLKKGWNGLAALPMWTGLKAIHRYVFKNWKRLAAETNLTQSSG